MYKIRFYLNQKGESSVKECIKYLSKREDKNSKLKLNKINDLIRSLSEHGLDMGMPGIRRISKGLWELRPYRDRIFFFTYHNEEFVLLHYFVKKTRKTPKKEIDKAIKEMNYYTAWRENNDKEN